MPQAPALGEKKKKGNANLSQKMALERHFLAVPEGRGYEEYNAITCEVSGPDGQKAFDYEQVAERQQARRSPEEAVSRTFEKAQKVSDARSQSDGMMSIKFREAPDQDEEELLEFEDEAELLEFMAGRSSR